MDKDRTFTIFMGLVFFFGASFFYSIADNPSTSYAGTGLSSVVSIALGLFAIAFIFSLFVKK